MVKKSLVGIWMVSGSSEVNMPIVVAVTFFIQHGATLNFKNTSKASLIELIFLLMDSPSPFLKEAPSKSQYFVHLI